MNQDVVLNGCVIAYSYDRLSKKCRSCMHKDYCDEKSKEKIGVLSKPVHLEPTAELSDLDKLGQAFSRYGVSIEEATEALVRTTTVLQNMDGKS